MNLVEFINSSFRNQHITHPNFYTLYVRKSRRYIRGIWYENVFDIANITAIRPGRGSFRRLLEELFKLWDGPIYVENVMSPRFTKYLLKHNFTLADGMDCYILFRITEKQEKD